MDGHIHEGDFYEEDEPLEEVVVAWERSSEGGHTAPPEPFYFVTKSINTGVGTTTIPFTIMPRVAEWVTAERAASNVNPDSALPRAG